MSDPYRQQYRKLTEPETAHIASLKTMAEQMLRLIEDAPVALGTGRPDGRMQALARTRLEECVMWAVKAVTG